MVLCWKRKSLTPARKKKLEYNLSELLNQEQEHHISSLGKILTHLGGFGLQKFKYGFF